MTASKSLPARPSLESLRKQAKKFARDIAAGDAGAIARARVHLPHADLPLTQRNAQLVIAREYGYPGWQDLTAEVSIRLGKGLEWAAAEALRIIHDNDVERLKQLLAEYPALLSWRADEKGRGVLGMATSAYGDAGDPDREQWFTRGACAEALIDAGAIVTPSVCEGVLQSRARGMLDLFQRKGLLPRTLTFLAALGDADAVRTALAEDRNDLAAVAEAFVRACLFDHEAIASLLLERSIALDPELGKSVDESVGRSAFVKHFIEKAPENARGIAAQTTTFGLWKVFVMNQVTRALHERDLTGFLGLLQRETWLLDEAFVSFQDELIGAAASDGREALFAALLDLEPAILRRRPAPPSPSQHIEQALVYGNAHIVPRLTRVWEMQDDLPHAAGMGDLEAVKRWFDTEGKPALGDVANHAPATSRWRPWAEVGVQQVLDTALAWAVINRQFDVADFLLEHGANVSTHWNSHEPASILHHVLFLPDPYERMQFLIDRGIDLTIKDYRWNSNAAGWARHALKDEKMAQWLEEAERQRKPKR